MAGRMRFPGTLLLGLAVLASFACRLPRESPAPRFWVIPPIEGRVAEMPVERSLGVGPVELPGYLDQAGVVTRPEAGRLRIAPYDRWAEPLGHNVIRVLARNLEILVPGLAAVEFPWRGPTQTLELRLVAQVSRFEAGPDGAVHLEAGWALSAGEGGALLANGRAAIREPVEGDDTQAVVAAMSRALGALSRRIAEAIEGADPESAPAQAPAGAEAPEG
jgi:uncharacterized lipoprotein YmbA